MDDQLPPAKGQVQGPRQPAANEMRYTFRFQKGPAGVDVRAFGKATVQGFAQLDLGLVEHPDWIPGMSVLFDFRELDLSGLTAGETRQSSAFVRSLSARFGSSRFACVMGKDVDYGIARMWEVLTGEGIPLEIQIFRSISEARNWLQRT